MAVVVRCPRCRGAAQIRPEAVGLLVACPRCSDPFVAVEETSAAPLPPPRRRQPAASPSSAPRRARVELLAPPDNPATDPHAERPEGGLPISVMIGLALIPFAIPLLWLIAPLVFGHQPAMSLATPASLAVAASALCLAVVFTVDWTPATRLKGVVMLVGLAYFTGLSLFFLKKDMLDQAREHFGPERGWHKHHPAGATYEVKFPGKPAGVPDQPLPNRRLTCHAATQAPQVGGIVFVVGEGLDARADDAAQRWFDDAAADLRRATGGTLNPSGREVPPQNDHDGREWEIRMPGKANPATRIVRLYRAGGRVYYLSAEGPHLTADDESVHIFFESFLITP